MTSYIDLLAAHDVLMARLDTLSAELRETRGKATGWQPIETAPKDGKRFIAYSPGSGLLFSMHWDGDCFLTDHELWNGHFTHWMPLPSPPEQT